MDIDKINLILTGPVQDALGEDLIKGKKVKGNLPLASSYFKTVKV